MCPLCGKKDHTLSSCPSKPKPCIDLVVAQLEASNLETNCAQLSSAGLDWVRVKPERRGRPRVMGRGFRGRRGSVYRPAPRSTTVSTPVVPNAGATEHFSPIHTAVHSPTIYEIHDFAVVLVSNAFATLGDYQVMSGDTITLNPLGSNELARRS